MCSSPANVESQILIVGADTDAVISPGAGGCLVTAHSIRQEEAEKMGTN